VLCLHGKARHLVSASPHWARCHHA
jgi:hypothetical protein